jgi:hypothetical protein
MRLVRHLQHWLTGGGFRLQSPTLSLTPVIGGAFRV